MVKFDKPLNLNGAELLAELNTAGVKTADFPRIDGNGDFWLDIANKDKAKAEEIVAAHNGNTVAPELSIEQKLASVGLSLDDLKTALGL